MIESPSLEFFKADQLGGQFFQDFTCRVHSGMGVLVVCQHPHSSTELIDMICGIQPPHAGTCSLMGRNLKSLTQREWRNLSPVIGFATGEVEMIHNLKVWENLILPLQARSTRRNQPSMDALEEKISHGFQAAGFRQVETYHLLRSAPDDLSHFEQTVCGLVRCHLSGFELLMAEQLFSGMDPDHSTRLLNLLNFLGSKHPESALLLIHHGSQPPDLSQLLCWQPVRTLTLTETSCLNS